MKRTNQKAVLSQRKLQFPAGQVMGGRLRKPSSGGAGSLAVARLSATKHRGDFNNVRNRLASAKTRKECAILTDGFLSERADLLAFAKFLHIPMQQGASRRRLREKIVEMTAGARIDADIIRRRR